MVHLLISSRCKLPAKTEVLLFQELIAILKRQFTHKRTIQITTLRTFQNCVPSF